MAGHTPTYVKRPVGDDVADGRYDRFYFCRAALWTAD